MAVVIGHTDWGRSGDKEGQRDYFVKWLVGANPDEGPQRACAAAGLFLVGDEWALGSDWDPWAFCLPNPSAEKAHVKGEIGNYWHVTQNFSTRPLRRCQDEQIDNPLMEPASLSGSFIKKMKEASFDKDGNPVVNTAWEKFHGSEVEFAESFPTVQIGFNSATLPLALVASMRDTLNDATLWGVPARGVLFNDFSWERLLYGTCTYYYRLTFGFEVDDSADGFGFDRALLNAGMKCLGGHSPGSPFKNTPIDPDAQTGGVDNYKIPANFEAYKDINGEVCRVLLDEKGLPLADGTAPYNLLLRKYKEANLLLLGIPSSLV